MIHTVGRRKVDVPISCRDCARGSGTVYRGIHRSSPDQLTACRTQVRAIPSTRMLYRQGEIPQAIFSVHKGWLCRVRQISDRKKQILSFIIPGDTITFSSIFMPGQPLSYGVQSITDVVLCSFERDKFRQLLHQERQFTEPYHQDLAEYLESITCRLADLGQRSAKARIARLFLELHLRHAKRNLVADGGFDFPVSQALLANSLGMTKAYINRSISDLRQQGLVILEAGRLTIPDLARLQAYAERK